MDEQSPPGKARSVVDPSKRRRERSWAILIMLLSMCALFFAITIVKMARF
jgi:hypothetical protein